MLLNKISLFKNQRKWKKELITSLNKIKKKGFYPKNILDIGAQYGQWTKLVRKYVYPDSYYQLIEPINYKELDNLKKFNNISCINILLGNKEEEVVWYEKRNGGDSIYKENTEYYKSCKGINKFTKKLDDINLKETNFDLIKIDTQGSEIDIIEGGLKLVSKAEFLLLEIPFFGAYNQGVPSFQVHIEKIDNFGFIPYDIVSLQRITSDILIQIDVLFVNKNSKFIKLGQQEISNLGR
tara:strand:- start:373 stop:1086 length:714 start_codon:yes stop_codon:yes gene_type:complete